MKKIHSQLALALDLLAIRTGKASVEKIVTRDACRKAIKVAK